MKVICVNDKGTVKLIKNKVYTAEILSEPQWRQELTTFNGKSVIRRRIYIKGVNSYQVERFSTINHQSLYSVPLFNDREEQIRIEDNDKVTGQYLKCYRDGDTQSLKSGQIYLVEDQITKIIKHPSFTRTTIKLKLKGIRYYFSSYYFSKIPIQEQRLYKLKSLNGETIKTGSDKRKFLHYNEKQKTLIFLELLLSIIKNIKNIDDYSDLILEDLILKKGRKYELIREDIKPFLENSITSTMKSFGLK